MIFIITTMLRPIYFYINIFEFLIYLGLIHLVWMLMNCTNPQNTYVTAFYFYISGRNNNKKVHHQKSSIYKENTLTDIEFVKCKRSQLLCTEYSSCIFYHCFLLQNRHRNIVELQFPY